MPQLWVVAGPNGVGKSTLTRRYLAGRLPIVDPNVLVQDLGPAAPSLTSDTRAAYPAIPDEYLLASALLMRRERRCPQHLCIPEPQMRP